MRQFAPHTGKTLEYEEIAGLHRNLILKLVRSDTKDCYGQSWPLESGLQSGEIKGNGNMLLSGAFIEERNSENVFTPPYLYTAETATTALRDDIIANAGWQDVPFPD